MNLAEALVAVPEIPLHAVSRKKLQLDPNLVIREELDENGDPIVVMFAPQIGAVYRIPPTQYELLKLFDGKRNYAEVSDAFQEKTGVHIEEQQIRALAVESQDAGIWYKSSQERNITLSQKLADERRKRIKWQRKKFDIAHTNFTAWDPDRYLTRLNELVGFIYGRRFMVFTLFLFVFMAVVWIGRFPELLSDSLLYYNFSAKSFGDIAEFWLLFLVIGFFHESAHGLTAKHFGAEVHSMGLQFIYLVPAFSVDITAVWVRTGKWQRIASMVAGIWIELLFCAIATLIWWGTPPGTPAHDFSYKVMLITGIMVVVLNINPLIKLDGYYTLAELTGIPDLKEKSTAYVSGWVKRHIFGFDVEYDFVPSRRRLLYVPYAIVSGVYSYFLLYAVARFCYNVFRGYTPELAFVPAVYVGWLIFSSRLKRLAAFMKTVYLQKKEHLRRVTSRGRLAFVFTVTLLFLVSPVWRKTVRGLFILEPVRKTTLRSPLPGRIEQVSAEEGAQVQSGASLLTMRNLAVETEVAKAKSERDIAAANEIKAQLLSVELGAARSEIERASRTAEIGRLKARQLEVVTPITGTVVTARMQDLAGTYVVEGATLVEVDDLSSMRARIYVPEFEVRDINPGAAVALRVRSSWSSLRGTVRSIRPVGSEIAEGLIEKTNYKGLNPPQFYIVDVFVPNNSGVLRPGMSGEAKILVSRESLTEMAWQEIHDFVGRRFW